jgi:hypothetical protein
MPQVIKFPDMRPPSRGGPIPDLPPLAQYRQMTPAIIAVEPVVRTPRLERKRLLMWFGVAVALHAALFLAIWLTPPLRLKWSPSPDAWVPVVSLPPKPPPPPAAAPAAGPAKPATSAAARPGAHKSLPAAGSLPQKAR